MRIILTPEEIAQIYNDGYLHIDLADGAMLYFEFDNKDNTFLYAEIYDAEKHDAGKHDRKKYVFTIDDYDRMIPTKPTDPFWNRLGYPTCLNCGTPMIYNFKFCPNCGQAIKWEK